MITEKLTDFVSTKIISCDVRKVLMYSNQLKIVIGVTR